MYHAARTNGHNPHQDKRETHRGDDHPSLADIVREETQDGRLIVRFLLSTMRGGLQDAKPCHQLDAARQLLKVGSEEARRYVEANTPARKRRASPKAPRRCRPSRLDRELADRVREETNGGGDAVRFLVDIMQSRLPDFKPHHRLRAAKELLRPLSDDTPAGDDRGRNAGRAADGGAGPSIDRRASYRGLYSVNPRRIDEAVRDANRRASRGHDAADVADTDHDSVHDDGQRPRPKEDLSYEEILAGEEAERAPVMEAFERRYRRKMAWKAADRGETVEPDPHRPDVAQGSPDPPEDEDTEVPWSKPGYVEEPSRWELKAMERGLDIWDSPRRPSAPDSTTRRWGLL